MSAGMKGLEERLRQATNFPFGEYAGNNDKPRCPVHVSDLVEAADRIATLEVEVVRLQLHSGKPWPIMVDGPHEIGDHRRWLARQLLDSKLTEHEAYGIVAYSPAITDRDHAALAAGEG